MYPISRFDTFSGCKSILAKRCTNHVKDAGITHLVDVARQTEPLQHVSCIWTEAVHEVVNVLSDIVLVTEQLLERKLRRVVEGLTCDMREEIGRGIDVTLQRSGFRNDFRFGGLEDAVKPPQDAERKDDLTILVTLVVVAQNLLDRPNEADLLRVRFRAAQYSMTPQRSTSFSRGQEPVDKRGARRVLGRPSEPCEEQFAPWGPVPTLQSFEAGSIRSQNLACRRPSPFRTLHK